MEARTTDIEPIIRAIAPEELAKTADLRRAMTLEVDCTDYDQAHPGWREHYAAFFGGLRGTQTRPILRR